MPCFAVGQNFVDSTAFRQDSIDIRTDSLRQRNAMYNCGTDRKDSFPKQHRLFSFQRFCSGVEKMLSGTNRLKVVGKGTDLVNLKGKAE